MLPIGGAGLLYVEAVCFTLHGAAHGLTTKRRLTRPCIAISRAVLSRWVDHSDGHRKAALKFQRQVGRQAILNHSSDTPALWRNSEAFSLKTLICGLSLG